MNHISCEIIRDLLPLYADDAASPDSRALVEAHLTECEACRTELERCRTAVALPPETEPGLMKLLRAKLLRRRVLLALSAALCTGLVLFGAFYWALCYRIALPYEPEIIRVVGVEQNSIRFSANHPAAFLATCSEREIETDGAVERVVYLGFSCTPADRLVNARLRPDRGPDESVVGLSDSPYPISRVYYKMPENALDFGSRTFFEQAHDDAPVLLWEAEGAPLTAPVDPVG